MKVEWCLNTVGAKPGRLDPMSLIGIKKIEKYIFDFLKLHTAQEMTESNVTPHWNNSYAVV